MGDGFVTFVLVFPAGFKLSIYLYPLKKNQVGFSVSDEKLKQGCELQAVQKTLSDLKQKLGRIPITFLGDSLYANEPMIKLLEILSWDYLIVRQPDTIKTLGRKCDELDILELYQKTCRDEEKTFDKEKTIERSAKWFNNVALGKKSFTNVLRYSEVIKDAKGEEVKKFRTKWLCQKPVCKGNWRLFIKRGRLRGFHEDMYNKLKNRGFAAKHNYGRTDPNLWLIWKHLMFVAFFIFELFSFHNDR